MIMNKNNPIFGVVERVEENDNYNGVSSPTADVTVDNVNREIRVDVNFEGMLGETNKTAYPGDKGEHTRWLVLHVEDELEAEIERAKDAEYALGTRITDINSDYILGDIRVQENIERTLSSYVTKQDMQEKLSQTTSALKQIVDFVDVENNTIVVNNETIDPIAGVTYFVNVETNEDSVIYKQYALLDGQLTLILPDLTEYAKTEYVDLISTSLTTNIQQLQYDIDGIQQDVTNVITDVDVVKNTYSTKDDLRNAIDQYSSSSRVVASSINVDNNTVVIDDTVISAVAGVVYLIAEVTNDGEDSYKQYTLIDNKLTLIGGAQIDLSAYATLEDVDNKVNNIDLTPYAKKEYVDKISADVETIMSTYSTKDELNNALEDYSNSSRVVVTSVNLDNNTIVINGATTDAVSGVVYLVAEVTNDGENSYKQYALINNELTLIGGTQIDLSAYAKLEDIPDVNNIINQALQTIEFIDGGTSTTIKF